MSQPPLTDAARSGQASFEGDKAQALIPQARLAGPMPWVLAIMVALTVWVVPDTRATPTQTTVNISTAVYEQLALRAQGRTGVDGQPMTVSGIVEELVTRNQ